MTPTDTRPYRQNVLGIFLNSAKEVLAVERSDRPGAWQLPQGGIDGDETPKDAIIREMAEELGVPPKNIAIVKQLPTALCYDFPPTLQAPIAKQYRGQQQIVFILALRNDTLPDMAASDGENRNWKWCSLEELAANIVDFKQAAYQKLIAIVSAYLAGQGSAQ